MTDNSKELNELEEFFKTAKIPKEVRISKFATITDTKQFLTNHISVVRSNISNPRYAPYMERLRELKQIIEDKNC